MYTDKSVARGFLGDLSGYEYTCTLLLQTKEASFDVFLA